MQWRCIGNKKHWTRIRNRWIIYFNEPVFVEIYLDMMASNEYEYYLQIRAVRNKRTKMFMNTIVKQCICYHICCSIRQNISARDIQYRLSDNSQTPFYKQYPQGSPGDL